MVKRSSWGLLYCVMGSQTTGPGFKTQWVGYTFYQGSDWQPPYPSHKVHLCVWKVSEGFLTQDIKMDICVFQCDVPHQWISLRQVSPVSVYCNGVGCRVLCLRHGIPVRQHIGQSTTATSRHHTIWPQMCQSDVKPQQTNKQMNITNIWSASCY